MSNAFSLTISSFSFLQIMANDNYICIICKETEEEEPGLKSFVPEIWETAKNAASNRMTLQSDHFFSTSEGIRKTD